ncbi:hypothetical protein DDZ18_02910 [Marinicauda salina]|uniref:Uncharacterized protein n=1 Tax=Marinicauda salina TaxID=2135793 RepID=A0A2U2BX55_9PROT|nr:hypothetical protein [Marinicauda salina]PWE18570.1 hypothetical protein DDZ18_02910 [Marinicauda salina]
MTDNERAGAQSQRFIKAAREAGCDEDPAELDRIMKRLDLRKKETSGDEPEADSGGADDDGAADD